MRYCGNDLVSPFYLKEWMIEKIESRGLNVNSILSHAGCSARELKNIQNKTDYRITENVAKILSSVFYIPLHSFLDDYKREL